jgi:hypothetical protein
MNINGVRLERGERSTSAGGCVAFEGELPREDLPPAIFIFSRARSVQDSDVVTALTELLSGDEGIGFRPGEGSEAFVHVEEFHEVI